MARLDRALANPKWQNLYKNALVLHESFGASDHKPLIIRQDWKHPRIKRGFKLEIKWNNEEGCKELIRKT